MKRQRNLETDYFSMNPYHRGPFCSSSASVFINEQANIAAEAHHYQEVYQKPAHKAMPKKNKKTI